MGDSSSLVALVLAKARTLLTREAAVTLAGLAAIVILAPRLRGRRDWGELRSRGFRTDLLYTLFYVGGFYGVLLGAPVTRLLRAGLSRTPLQTHLLDGLPAAGQFAIAFVLGDLITYWVHRWSHASPLLWKFHAIHHSQIELTALTNFRLHCVDALLRGAVPALALTLLGNVSFGGLPWVWLVGCAYALQQGLAHSDLDWGFGVLGRVWVSPRFHRVHHSTEPREQDRNYGAAFSLWDRLFGTADEGLSRPQAYGTPRIPMPESFLRQLAFPLVWLVKGGVRS